MRTTLLIAFVSLKRLAGAVHLRGYGRSPLEPIIDGVLSDLLGDVPVTAEERELTDFARSGRQEQNLFSPPWSSTTLTQTTSTLRDGRIHSMSKTFIDGRLVNSYQTTGDIWTRHLPLTQQIPTPAEILDLTGLTKPETQTEPKTRQVSEAPAPLAEAKLVAEEALPATKSTKQHEKAHEVSIKQEEEEEQQQQQQQQQQQTKESPAPQAPATTAQRQSENPQQDAAAAAVPSSGNDSAASPRAEIRRRLR